MSNTADLSSWTLEFDGRANADSSDFIVKIRRYAFSNGKDRDDEWTARFAGTCFTGPALLWYEDLDDRTQDSWKLLRRALLSKYPPNESTAAGAEPSRAIIPTPAAAPAPARAAPPPAQPAGPSSPRRGRIKAYGTSGRTWYLAGTPQPRERVEVAEKADALIVEAIPSENGLHLLKITNWLPSKPRWLGITWYPPSVYGKRMEPFTGPGDMTACEDSRCIGYASNPRNGEPGRMTTSDVWLLERNNSLKIVGITGRGAREHFKVRIECKGTVDVIPEGQFFPDDYIITLVFEDM